MKVELHLHTSRRSPCGRCGPEELIAQLIAAEYDAVYLTEHDAVWPANERRALQRKFPAIRIFPGIECTIGEPWQGQHLVVLGTDDPEYARLSEPSEVLAKARIDGHLTVLAHPLRRPRSADILWMGLHPDALEGRTCNHDEARGHAIARTAARLGLPLVNAGDVHRVTHVDRCWIQTRYGLEHPDDIRDVVLSRAYDSLVNEPAAVWG